MLLSVQLKMSLGVKMKVVLLINSLIALLAVRDVQAGGIPCVDDAGAVKNATGEVCKAILPKCTDLRNKLISQVKNQMEWKIYGYYHQGIDLDLNQSDLKNKKFVGQKLAYPLCSVVGHKVSGGSDAGEVNQQQIGNMFSCGDYPEAAGVDAWTYKLHLTYKGNQGTKWYSYVLGAYPWVIRRQAHEVISNLKEDLSNLDEVIKTPSMNDSVKKTLEEIRLSVSKISAEAKPLCNLAGQESSKLLSDCVKKPSPFALNSPQMSICNLVSAQQFLNEMSVPSMLSFETLSRAQKMQDEKFAKVFQADQHPQLKSLMKVCSNNQGMVKKVLNTITGIFSLGVVARAVAARKAQACVTSCLFDGSTYHTFNNFVTGKNDNGAQYQRKCAKVTRFDLDKGEPVSTSLSTLIASEPYLVWLWDAILGSSYSENRQTEQIDFLEKKNRINPTNNNGFAGMIEYIIRREICPQEGNKKTGTNVCDSIGIGNKPSEVI